MRLQTKKKLSYLLSLTLLFSYVESVLPRTVPFFRLGLGNVAILLAFDLPPYPFLLLAVLKATASALFSGTLLTPFFLISLVQSFFSAFFMLTLEKMNGFFGKKLVSVYGISVLGSALSAFIQIFCCSLYLGMGTFALLGPMLIFNTISGIVTAFFSTKISYDENFLPLEENDFSRKEDEQTETRKSQIFFTAGILILGSSVFFINKILILTSLLVLCILLQIKCKRKILVLPHISLWVFILISTMFTPEGKILFRFWNFSLTETSLIQGVQKSLRLSALSALSQCAIFLKPPKGSILEASLLYYKTLSEKFRRADGNIFKRIEVTLGKD